MWAEDKNRKEGLSWIFITVRTFFGLIFHWAQNLPRKTDRLISLGTKSAQRIFLKLIDAMLVKSCRLCFFNQLNRSPSRSDKVYMLVNHAPRVF